MNNLPRYKIIEIDDSENNFIVEICSGEYTGINFKIYEIWLDDDLKLNFNYKIMFCPSELINDEVNSEFTDLICEIVLHFFESVCKREESTYHEHINNNPERTI